MGLEEQRTAALPLELGDHLPGEVLVLDRVGRHQRNRFVTEVPRSPYRSKLRVNEVGAASGVRNLADIDQGDFLVSLGIDHGDLV